MMPSLGEKYDVEIETTSKPKAEYLTDEYFAFDLPVAPAIIVGDKIVIEGQDVDDHVIEMEICKQLGLPEPEQSRKGIMNKLFSR